MPSPNSLVLTALAGTRHQAGFDEANRDSRPRDPAVSRIVGNAAHVVLPLAYLIAISLATWGGAHLVDAAPRPSASACVTSGIRPVISADVRGTGEVCVAAAAVRASVYADQLRPGGTYTTLLLYHLDPATACSTACVPDPGSPALSSRIVRVVDTSNADEFGRLQVSQDVSTLSLAHGSTARLVLVELVRQPASQLNEVALPNIARHRVDRLPDVDSETPVAEAVLHVP